MSKISILSGVIFNLAIASIISLNAETIDSLLTKVKLIPKNPTETQLRQFAKYTLNLQNEIETEITHKNDIIIAKKLNYDSKLLEDKYPEYATWKQNRQIDLAEKSFSSAYMAIYNKHHKIAINETQKELGTLRNYDSSFLTDGSPKYDHPNKRISTGMIYILSQFNEEIRPNVDFFIQKMNENVIHFRKLQINFKNLEKDQIDAITVQFEISELNRLKLFMNALMVGYVGILFPPFS